MFDLGKALSFLAETGGGALVAPPEQKKKVIPLKRARLGAGKAIAPMKPDKLGRVYCYDDVAKKRVPCPQQYKKKPKSRKKPIAPAAKPPAARKPKKRNDLDDLISKIAAELDLIESAEEDVDLSDDERMALSAAEDQGLLKRDVPKDKPKPKLQLSREQQDRVVAFINLHSRLHERRKQNQSVPGDYVNQFMHLVEGQPKKVIQGMGRSVRLDMPTWLSRQEMIQELIDVLNEQAGPQGRVTDGRGRSFRPPIHDPRPRKTGEVFAHDVEKGDQLVWKGRPRRVHKVQDRPNAMVTVPDADGWPTLQEGGTLVIFADGARAMLPRGASLPVVESWREKRLRFWVKKGFRRWRVKAIEVKKDRRGYRYCVEEGKGRVKCPPKTKKGSDPSDAEGDSPTADVDYSQVHNVSTSSLSVDPERFQYKLNVDESGVTEELKAVKTFNPLFAGVVLVWKDPENGKDYVVNGHHRYELAKRTGYPSMAIRYLDASDAVEARALGALVNIAEGRGTAIDAAKFMRDTGTTVEDFEEKGISIQGRVAKDATAILHLNDRLFDRLARGLISEGVAVAVGRNLKDHNLQDDLFRLMEKKKGKDFSLRVVAEMAKEMAATPKVSRSEQTLFGDWESEESLFVERNELKSHIRSALAREAGDFKVVSSQRRADRLTSEGNVIDVDANKERARRIGQLLWVYDQLVNRSGEVSQAINEAAKKYATAQNKKEKDRAKKEAYQMVKTALKQAA